MEYFWAIFATTILLLILYGIISSSVRNRRIRRETASLLPTLSDHIQKDRRYNIILNNNRSLDNVLFLGVSKSYDRNVPNLPFPLCEWLVVQRSDGKKAYIKPSSVRYYEDA
jgi:hypothetical protein